MALSNNKEGRIMKEELPEYFDKAIDLLIEVYETCNTPVGLQEQIENLLHKTDNYQYLSR